MEKAQLNFFTNFNEDGKLKQEVNGMETKPETTSEMKVETTVTQAPVLTAPMVPPQAQSLPAYPPAQAPIQMSVQQVPPIHVHVNPEGNTCSPPQGRGQMNENRGPPPRGMWRGGPMQAQYPR